MSKQVRLKSVSLTDFKGISQLAADINGHHFIAFGKNGAGKTSLFEVINRSAVRVEPKEMSEVPIKLGQKNAQTGIVYQIEEDGSKKEILVQTIYRPSSTEMKVIDLSNNGELKPPIQSLIGLIGESHDVSSLMDLQPHEQFKELLKMLGGTVASDNYEEAYTEKYMERRSLNKTIKEAEGRLKETAPNIGILQEHRTQGAYAAEITEVPEKPNTVQLLIEKSRAISRNDERKRASEARDEIIKQIEHLQKRLAAADKWLADNPEEDLWLYQERINAVDEKQKAWEAEVASIQKYNATVKQIAAFKEAQNQLEGYRQRRDNIQGEMDGLTSRMKENIASLNLSEIVPELMMLNTVDESGYKPIIRQGLYYKLPSGESLPFSPKQISYGKMIVALCKLSAFVNHDKFNLFRIPQWNELDKESQEEVMAFDRLNPDLGLQFGIEKVEEAPIGIRVIERKIK